MFSEGFRYKILHSGVWGNRLDPPDLKKKINNYEKRHFREKVGYPTMGI